MSRVEGQMPESRPIPRDGLLFGILSGLPLVETMLYNAHVGPGSRTLSFEEYIQLSCLCLLLLALHVLCFIIPEGTFKRVLQRFSELLNRTQQELRRTLIYALMALPLLFLLVLFGGESSIRLLVQTGILGTVLLPLLYFAVITALLWPITKILRMLAEQLGDLRGAINEWAFSIRLSVVFYLLLVAATLRVVSFEGIQDEATIEFGLGIAKDYLLLFIIAGILFAGLYKIGTAGQLKDLFQTERGFLHFVLICGVIAILAIWADFNGMSPVNQDRIFRHQWQKQFNRVHVYTRDIGLLLMPIAGLLIWSLSRLSDEMRKGKPPLTSRFRPSPKRRA